MCMFGSPSIPQMAPPPAPVAPIPAPEPLKEVPVPDSKVAPLPTPADPRIAQARAANTAKAGSNQGRQATILTGGQGLLEEGAGTKKKTLLGA